MADYSFNQYRQFTETCWIVLVVIWLIGTISAKRIKERWASSQRIGYILLFLFSCHLVFRHRAGDSIIIAHSSEAGRDGAIIVGIGFFVAVWARMILATNWSGAVALKEDHELVEKGPYRWVRHPIYTGILLMLAGTAIVTGTTLAWIGVAGALALHLWKLRLEEELMEKTFSEAYPAYKARTKALVPFLF